MGRAEERATCRAPDRNQPRRRRAAALLPLAVAAAATAIVALSFLLLIMRDLPGDVDAALLSCSRCSSPAFLDGGVAGLATTSLGVCDGGGDGDDTAEPGWREELAWILIRRTLQSHCDEAAESGAADACVAETEEEQLCRACEEYRRVRSHVRVGRMTLHPGWWHRCEILVQNVSLSSRGGIFIERSPLARGVATYFPVSRNVLRFDVLDGGHGSGDAAPPRPPPAVEINDMRMMWRSWKYPVVDAHVSGVTFNVVIATNKSGTLGMPLPVVTVGDTLIDEVLEMLPKPPEEEGSYPRIGVVNITNVTVLFHTAPDRSVVSAGNYDDGYVRVGIQPLKCSGKELEESLEKDKSGHFAKFDVPSDYFDSLLHATTAASAAGIDQFHFNSVVLGALKSVIRHQLLHEEDFLDFVGNMLEMSQALKEGGLGKLNDGAHFIDAFIIDGRAALDHWWRDLRHDWKEKNEQFSVALHKVETKWDNLLHSIHLETSKVEKYVDDLAKSLREFKMKTADWKSVFPKIADDWKQGWADVEQSWAKKVMPHVVAFVADAKDEMKNLQGVLKGKIELMRVKQ